MTLEAAGFDAERDRSCHRTRQAADSIARPHVGGRSHPRAGVEAVQEGDYCARCKMLFYSPLGKDSVLQLPQQMLEM